MPREWQSEGLVMEIQLMFLNISQSKPLTNEAVDKFYPVYFCWLFDVYF